MLSQSQYKVNEHISALVGSECTEETEEGSYLCADVRRRLTCVLTTIRLMLPSPMRGDWSSPWIKTTEAQLVSHPLHSWIEGLPRPASAEINTWIVNRQVCYSCWEAWAAVSPECKPWWPLPSAEVSLWIVFQWQSGEPVDWRTAPCASHSVLVAPECKWTTHMSMCIHQTLTYEICNVGII